MRPSTLLAAPNAKSPVTNGDVDPGVSIRFGAVQDKDVKMEDAEDGALGASKRKSRVSIGEKKSYAEEESSEEEEPLVRFPHRLGLVFPTAVSTVPLVTTSNHLAE